MKTKRLQSLIFTFLIQTLLVTNSYSTIRDVTVSNFVFSPANITANVGDTVRWTWINGGHTTTCDGSTLTSLPPGAAPWDAPITPVNPIFIYVITVVGTYNYKCDPHIEMLGVITVTSPSLSLNLTTIIEGFWNGSTMVSDTVKVNLHSSTFPYVIVATAKILLDPSGNGVLTFSNASSGAYYIEVRHRNALETWSKTPQTFMVGSTTNYDFTTAANKAFGDNLIFKLGKFANYSGDVNQDGTIDGSDLSLIDNDANFFISGYVSTDVNGDTVVDGTDGAITENNAANFVSVARPKSVNN